MGCEVGNSRMDGKGNGEQNIPNFFSSSIGQNAIVHVSVSAKNTTISVRSNRYGFHVFREAKPPDGDGRSERNNPITSAGSLPSSILPGFPALGLDLAPSPHKRISQLSLTFFNQYQKQTKKQNTTPAPEHHHRACRREMVPNLPLDKVSTWVSTQRLGRAPRNTL